MEACQYSVVRVLITGGAGTLGQALLPQLAAAGHEAVVFDIEPRGSRESAALLIRGDVRRPDDVVAAVEAIDVVVHTAALHGIHLANHSPQEFFDLNISGTFNVWQAAVRAKVKAFVFSSTMGVYGESRRPATEDDVVVVHEELPLLPGDV
jgi:UDP-glucose 4-epimerase